MHLKVEIAESTYAIMPLKMHVNCVVVITKKKIRKKDADCEINEIFIAFVIDLKKKIL